MDFYVVSSPWMESRWSDFATANPSSLLYAFRMRGSRDNIHELEV
jgi:hypothetical protein